MLKNGDVSLADVFGDADVISKGADRFRSHSSAANTRNGWQARIIPTRNDFLVDQLNQLPFGNDHVAWNQFRELVLMRQRPRQIEVLQNPIIQWPMHLEL